MPVFFLSEEQKQSYGCYRDTPTCTLERLCDGLRRRDLFVAPSVRWSNPHAKLLQGKDWESVRPQICRTLNLQSTPTAELEKLKQQLNEAFHRTANNLPSNTAVRVEPNKKGHDTLTVSNLDKLEEPTSLKVHFDRLTTSNPDDFVLTRLMIMCQFRLIENSWQLLAFILCRSESQQTIADIEEKAIANSVKLGGETTVYQG